MSSRRERISSFSVESTPTVLAFSGKVASSPFQRAAGGRQTVSLTLFKSSSFTVRVSIILASIASLSKFAFVIVMKRLRVIRWLTSELTGVPSFLSAVVTADIPFVT